MPAFASQDARSDSSFRGTALSLARRDERRREKHRRQRLARNARRAALGLNCKGEPVRDAAKQAAMCPTLLHPAGCLCVDCLFPVKAGERAPLVCRVGVA